MTFIVGLVVGSSWQTIFEIIQRYVGN